MTFDSRQRSVQPGHTLFEDRFRHVESAIVFRKVECHRCDFSSIYKYQVQQVRRKEAIEVGPDDEVRPDHVQIWNAIPRFAEIPETVKCKRCGEVLGLCTECIF